MNAKISRRTVLRGMGAAVALPALEAMLPLTALAQSAPLFNGSQTGFSSAVPPLLQRSRVVDTARPRIGFNAKGKGGRVRPLDK